jgi:hypothetical protein
MNNPVWLKVVCIVSIILGSLGLLMSLMGIAGQLMIEAMHSAMLSFVNVMPQAGPQQQADAMKEFFQASIDVQLAWRPLNMVLMGLNLFVASALVAGGIQALRMKPAGRKLLLAALAAAAVFEMIRGPATVAVQWQMSKSMGPLMQRMMEASTPAGANLPPGQQQMIENMQRSIMVSSALMGMVTTLSMAVVKIAFYIAGVWLLLRPHIRAMYSPQLASAEVVA